MIAIHLALCMQLSTLCIQLSHSYSAPKLEKASFKLEPQYERSDIPIYFFKCVCLCLCVCVCVCVWT